MTPKKIVHFMEADGFPFDQDTFDYLQTNLRLIEKIAALGSETDAYIVQGCTDGGATVSDGWIYSPWFGLVPLQGGTKKAYINLTVSTEDAVFNDGVTTVNATKYSNLLLQFSDTPSGVSSLWSDIKRFKNLKTLTDEVNELRDKLLPGNWINVNVDIGAPIFENGWDNYAGSQPLQFKKKDSQTVVIRGTIRSGTAPTVFLLPVGYRPQWRQNHIVRYGDAIGYLVIKTTGEVQCGEIVGGSNTFVALNFEFNLEE